MTLARRAAGLRGIDASTIGDPWRC
ncbi:hypothetical protein BRAS3843_2730005 [Bradyrhizobium sp. STM 3843]|nr:hypothetical protein BRAS3843_2730005 [Bradyrhizobium sp. STM 3843]